MSALVQRHQEINLSQDFPDFDGPAILNPAGLARQPGRQSIYPCDRVAPLREAYAGKTAELYDWRPDTEPK